MRSPSQAVFVSHATEQAATCMDALTAWLNEFEEGNPAISMLVSALQLVRYRTRCRVANWP
jgi:hypothetical protein